MLHDHTINNKTHTNTQENSTQVSPTNNAQQRINNSGNSNTNEESTLKFLAKEIGKHLLSFYLKLGFSGEAIMKLLNLDTHKKDQKSNNSNVDQTKHHAINALTTQNFRLGDHHELGRIKLFFNPTKFYNKDPYSHEYLQQRMAEHGHDKEYMKKFNEYKKYYSNPENLAKSRNPLIQHAIDFTLGDALGQKEVIINGKPTNGTCLSFAIRTLLRECCDGSELSARILAEEPEFNSHSVEATQIINKAAGKNILTCILFPNQGYKTVGKPFNKEELKREQTILIELIKQGPCNIGLNYPNGRGHEVYCEHYIDRETRKPMCLIRDSGFAPFGASYKVPFNDVIKYTSDIIKTTDEFKMGG